MNHYIIRQALPKDLNTIMHLTETARLIMQQNGNKTQWPQGTPSRACVENDLKQGDCFLVCTENGDAVGSFVLRQGPDPSYGNIYEGAWLDDKRPYHVIHRVTSIPEAHGIFSAIMDFCSSVSDNLRIDTHRNNTIMQHLVRKYGFNYCGIIHIANLENDYERLAFQRLESK